MYQFEIIAVDFIMVYKDLIHLYFSPPSPFPFPEYYYITEFG